MMKIKIIDHLTHRLKEDIKNLKLAANTSKVMATDSDNKAESKWDTRAIEAGYLAGAQVARINELEQELEVLKSLNLKELNEDDEIIMGALVNLECNDQERQYFLSPITGGLLIEIENTPIMVVSVFSPIGREMLGLTIGESFELNAPSGKKEYTVLKVN